MTPQKLFSQRHPRLAGLLAHTLVVVFLLFAFELGLRLFAPPWLSFRMAHLRAMGDVGAEPGMDRDWKLVKKDGQFLNFLPHSKFAVLQQEYKHQVEIDELGGRKVMPQRNSPELIPFLGDSFTFGLGVENDQTFVSLLQSNISFRLLNLGAPAIALPGQRFIIENRHQDLGSPKLYVLSFFLGFDFQAIYKFHHKTAGLTTNKNDRTDMQNHAWLRRINYFVNNTVLGHIYLIQFVRQRILEQVNKGASVEMMNPIFLMMNRDLSEYHAAVHSYLEVEVNALQEMSRKLGCKFIIVVIPDEYQICPELSLPKVQYYGLDVEKLDADAPNAILTGVLREHGIDCIDPTKSLQAAPNNERFFYLHDGHLTPEGHRFFADAIRPELQAKINEVMRGTNAENHAGAMK